MKNTIHIAYADDHALVRESIAGMLNTHSRINVIMQARDGSELLEKLAVVKVLPDICILDIHMEPMNGYQAAAAIKEQYPDIKTLAVSMFDDEFCIISMLRNGARGYIHKSAEPVELFTVLENLYQNGFYMEGLNPEIATKAMMEGEPSYSELHEAELQLLQLLCSEYTYRQIAKNMCMSERTLDKYRLALFDKVGVSTRQGLVLFAMLTGLGTDKVPRS